MEKQPLSGSEQKIREYIERIKGGESKDSILQGLPPSFANAIETGLRDTERISSGIEGAGVIENKEETSISPQHDGLDKQRKIDRQKEDDKQIAEIRAQLGVPEKEDPDFNGDEHLQSIYGTMKGLAGGAKEGFAEDVERKIVKYVDEIRSGKDPSYVLDGAPKKWRDLVMERLSNTGQEITLEKKKEIGQHVLTELNRLSSNMHLSGGDAIINGTWNGDFRGEGDSTLEVDQSGNIVLRRGARDEDAMVKLGLAFTNKKELYDTSLTNGAGNGVPTASNSKVGESYVYGSGSKYMGVFRIPQEEFLNLAKEGKIILGNIGESEVVISPEVASKYLVEVNGNKI